MTAIRGAEGSRHGRAVPHGQRPPAGSHGGRFGRMFPFLPARDPGECAVRELTDFLGIRDFSLLPSSADNLRIPAGYTYLGQFVDHDITFDPTSRLHHENDLRALVNFRTPRLDLDSLYGSGPRDQPFLYDWQDADHPGARLLVDRPSGAGLAAMDLPRNVPGRALIGDARNDENLILAQLHLLFIRFHNAVVGWLAGQGEWRHSARRGLTDELFEEARRIVRWHYQWIVTHDFLRRVAGDDMAKSVLHDVDPSATPVITRRFFRWRSEPAIPVEFSGAAYRFGHSMVRQGYLIKAGSAATIFPSGPSGQADLTGFRRLTTDLEIDWDLFFFTEAEEGQNFSKKIDAALVLALFELPHAVAPLGRKLALLNLERGRALGLPCGQDVSHAMSVEPLTHEDLLPERATPEPISQDSREVLLRATPLWFYILREAEKRGKHRGGVHGGEHLGPVGGRIVAEVLVGLLEADPHSYVRQWPMWRPGIERPQQDFTMIDLLAFVREQERARG